MKITKFRKLIKGITQFGYQAEIIELESYGKLKFSIETIKCAKTTLRKKEPIAYEGLIYDLNKNEKEWTRVEESQYLKLISDHKAKGIIIKNKEIEALDIKAIDFFDLSDHFQERIEERFINVIEGTFPVLEYVLQNGYYLGAISPEYLGHRKGRIIIYEPDMQMYIVARETTTGFFLITTIESNSKWLQDYLKDNPLKESQKLRKYVRDNYEEVPLEEAV